MGSQSLKYGIPTFLNLNEGFLTSNQTKSVSFFKGDVANEVETEQIVVDSTISDLNKANVTSFVQIRGSVPGQWSQDTAAMLPKPQIYFQNPDPTSKIAGKWKILLP